MTQLKPLLSVTDPMPLWSESLWHLLDWAARYYHHPLGEVLAPCGTSCFATRATAQLPIHETIKINRSWQAVELTELSRAPQQQRLIAQLRREALAVSDLAQHDVRPAAVKALKEKGLIEETLVAPAFSAWTPELAEEPHPLNPEQAVAVAAIHAGMQAEAQQTWLLKA